jgi:small GTP-binding protein
MFIGEPGVGKTCFQIVAATGHFPGDYTPTVYDRSSVQFGFNLSSGRTVFCSLDMWDTAGQSDYDRLRPLSYPATDVFVLCYCTAPDGASWDVQKRYRSVRSGYKEASFTE